jgi:CxxC-x17-CxxC domain-containing protein
MKNFNGERREGNGGGYRGNDRGGDRGGFAKKPWDNDRPTQMFKATCAECGKSCDVPFRPTGEKPVYCNDCFSKKRDGADTRGGSRDYGAPKSYDNSFEKRGFNDRFAPRADARPAYTDKPAYKPAPDNSKALTEISMKLDRLITAMEKMTGAKAVHTPDAKPAKAATPAHAGPDLSDIAEIAGLPMLKKSKPKTAKKVTKAKPAKKASKKK